MVERNVWVVLVAACALAAVFSPSNASAWSEARHTYVSQNLRFVEYDPGSVVVTLLLVHPTAT